MMLMFNCIRMVNGYSGAVGKMVVEIYLIEIKLEMVKISEKCLFISGVVIFLFARSGNRYFIGIMSKCDLT